MDEELDGVEVYETAGQYVLGSRDDRYGIWDRADLTTAVATFPGDDHGLEQAERLLGQLARAEAGRRIPKALLIAAIGGFAVWVVAGLVREILLYVDTQVQFDVAVGIPGLSKASALFAIIETTAFRVGVSAMLVMGALWLYRSLRHDD